jgi:Permuted papain-like amidase enzyme, YaeF/YiiX, C92 family
MSGAAGGELNMPHSGNASPTQARSNALPEALQDMTALAGRAPRDEADLRDSLKAIYQALLLADFSTFDVAAVKAAAPQLVQQTFEVRLQLRHQIAAWDAAGLISHPVQAVLRDVFRASRYAGEMLGELHLGHARLAGDAVHAAFTGPGSCVQINPSFAHAPLAFQAGDVVLVRGRVHNSAAIARIGDVDSQFSHVGIFATGAEGHLVMVEALIEEGSVINPVAKALNHGLGRAMLFRHRDANLAKEAAELVHDHVQRKLVASGPIPYDFGMELNGYEPMFCAKLVRMAYAMGSSGDYRMPRFPTRLDMRNRDFLERIGVTATQTFAPGDIELESDFDLVAEWRDYRVTSELRLKDMIMTKLFAWMENEGYRFEPSLNIDMIALLGRATTHLPDGVQDLIASVVSARVPDNMSYDTIGAVAMLHKTAEPIYEELEQLETESIMATGRQLHPRQVFEVLEQIRARDPAVVGYLVK